MSNSWSPWVESRPDPAPPLAGDRRLDVAIVGAGYTGLGAAIALRRDGRSVAVLEREESGFGASGRNAGHLTPTIGKDLPTLLLLYGRERTKRFLAFAEAAVEHVEQTIARHAIDCEYEPVGNVMAAVHDSQIPRLEKAAKAAASVGARVSFLDASSMRERRLPTAFRAGALEERGGILHPGKLLFGLRRLALEAGAELYDGTPCLRIDDGPTLRVQTPRGSIRADRVILATNAFTPEIGRLGSRVAPVIVSLFRTEPLSSADLERIGWTGREGIYTAHEILESYRWTAEGRIVGGSRYVRYDYGGKIDLGEDRDTYTRLESTFRERFPGIEVRIERFWSGPIAVTLDFLPSFGCTGRFRNILYAIGYNGHGVAQATYAGTVLADWIEGRETRGFAIVKHRTIPLPPEPLRWLVARGLIAFFSRLDRRTDEKVRQADRLGPRQESL